MDLTVEQIDEALAQAMTIPADERGPVWTGWTDGLLEQRIRLDLANPRK